MATQAKRVSKTGHASFSSITARVDDLSAAAKGAEVNEGMTRVAEESGCQYICNHDNFLCRNSDVNTELVAVYGLHVSKHGTERLIENLKLYDTACCRIGRSQRPGLDPQQKHSRPWRGTEPAAPGPVFTNDPISSDPESPNFGIDWHGESPRVSWNVIPWGSLDTVLPNCVIPS